MPAVARIGDPVAGGGTILTGSANVRCNGIGVARRGDAVMCPMEGGGSGGNGETTTDDGSIGGGIGAGSGGAVDDGSSIGLTPPGGAGTGGGIILDGSHTVRANGRPLARVGDPTTCGPISSGSPNVRAGG